MTLRGDTQGDPTRRWTRAAVACSKFFLAFIVDRCRAAAATQTLGGNRFKIKMPFFKKKESLTADERLLGTWRLVTSNGAIDGGTGVTMTFMCNGRLLYVIHEKQSDEIMNLSFTVEGDRLVTNQPSRPQMESTKFSFEDDGHLVLDYGGSKSWFARA